MAITVKNARVWLNGIEIHMVAKFNVAEGWVEAFVTSPTHYSNVDLSGGDFIVSRLYGHVEVEYG